MTINVLKEIEDSFVNIFALIDDETMMSPRNETEETWIGQNSRSLWDFWRLSYFCYKLWQFFFTE